MAGWIALAIVGIPLLLGALLVVVALVAVVFDEMAKEEREKEWWAEWEKDPKHKQRHHT